MARHETFSASMIVSVYLAGAVVWQVQSARSYADAAHKISVAGVAGQAANGTYAESHQARNPKPDETTPGPDQPSGNKPNKNTDAASGPKSTPIKKKEEGPSPAIQPGTKSKAPDRHLPRGGFDPKIPDGSARPDPTPGSVVGLKTVALESGVKYWDIREGTGPAPDEGAMIINSFRAWLMNGEDVGPLVDSSSHQRHNPAAYKHDLVRGLQEGLWTMREGGIRQVFVPSRLCWGETGKPPAIPPNSDMLFQVQLMEVRNPPVPSSVSGIEPKKTKSGVKYWDLKVGDGPVVVPHAEIKVRYTGWLENSTVFDTTEMVRQPKPFSLSSGNVIQGWREGIPGMRVGGKRKLEIPPALAYGRFGAGPIPPDETLTFEIHMTEASDPRPQARPLSVADIKPVKTESGLRYWDVKVGGGETPEEESTVTVHYTIWIEDGSIAQTTRDAGIPRGLPLHRLNAGMREGIASMKVGGIRQMRVPPDLAYGEHGSPPDIPPNATLTIEVELAGIQ